MSKRNRVELRVERLETLALMTTLPALTGLPTGSTGLGSIGTITTYDATSLQQDASGGALEQQISEIETTYGRRADVKAYAQQVVANHAVTDYDLDNTAAGLGLTLPPGVALPSDLSTYQMVLKAVHGGNVDKAYLTAMKQINAQDVTTDQVLISATSNQAVRAYASETAAYDQNHVDGATALLKSAKATYNPTVPTTTITGTVGAGTAGTASAADTQALQTDESGGALEVFISSIEAAQGKRSDVAQFAQEVVGDHQVTNYDLQATAVGTNVTIPAGITDSMDIQDAKKVLVAASGSNLDSVYLKVIAQVNATDVSDDQQLNAATANARIKAYAQETLGYDMSHLQDAQTLQATSAKSGTPFPPSSTNGG